MNVLLIEDNELNRDMLKRRLERNEYLVLCAEDGQSGLDMARNEIPDIILLDLTNVISAADMDDTTSSIQFNQYYYDAVLPAKVDSAKITVGTECDWTSTASTQDSYMSFSTGLNGTVAEKVRITSDGNVGIGTTAPDANLEVCTTGANTVKIQSTNSRARLCLYSSSDNPTDLFMGTNADYDRFSLSVRSSSGNHKAVMYSNNAGWQELQVWNFTCDAVTFPAGCVGIGTATP